MSPSPSFGEQIQALRIGRGLTSVELATRSGLRADVIEHYEFHQKGLATRGVFNALAAGLGLSHAERLGVVSASGYDLYAPSPASPALSPRMKEGIWTIIAGGMPYWGIDAQAGVELRHMLAVADRYKRLYAHSYHARKEPESC